MLIFRKILRTYLMYGPLVRKSAIKTQGSHGRSGLYADFWSKTLCNSTFSNESDDLYHAIALLARMLCFEELVDPKSME